MRLLELFEAIKPQPVTEAVQLKGLELWAYAVIVAEAYMAAPAKEPQAMKAYQVLAKANDVLFKRLSAKTDVQFTQDDPYGGPEDVAQDITQNQRLKVFTGGDDHPALTREQNNVFRTVHDYFAHVGPNVGKARRGQKFTSHNFTYRGELNAYLVHAKMAPQEAVPVLFTEVVGQASYFLIMDDFPPQKAAILEGFDYFRLGRMSQQHQQRYQEVLSELRDDSTETVRVNLNGGMDYPKAKINRELMSTATQQKPTVGLGESQIFEYDERYEYWIDDSGNLIDVSDCGHESAAANILGTETGENGYEASDQAFMNGWIRVMASGNEFGTEWEQPTRRAVKALTNMVKDVPEFTNYYFGKMFKPIVGKRQALAWLGQELRQSKPVRESQEELLRLNQESQRLHKIFHQAWNDYKDNPSEETGKAFKAAEQAYYAVANQEQELSDQQRTAEPEPEQHEYRGQHESPGPDDAPLHDLTQNGIYPDDIYGPNGLRYYATTDEERAALSQALQFRGRPNAQVRIYRAVPTSAGKVKIEPGDWVTISRRYAKEHGQDNLGGDFRIISKTVNARSLFTDGNSPEEWGYHPQPRVRRS